ncbi:hypothetical protein ACTOWA_00570 [Herbaspirillum seropedicae]|nr:hypothetical protein [Herbaspirillum seropedicae]
MDQRWRKRLTILARREAELGQLIPQGQQTNVVDDYVAALTAEVGHFN